MFSGTAAPTERIYSLRREATDFYRAVHPLLGVVTGRADQDQRPAERHHRAAHDPGDRLLRLTFITGFFGQNFAWLVRHISSDTAFIVYGLGGLAVPLGPLLLRLRTLHTNAAVPAHDS